MAALYRSFYILNPCPSKLWFSITIKLNWWIYRVSHETWWMSWMSCHGTFFIILFDIKQLNKSWKKTFQTVNQLSCFAGHHVEEKKETERILVSQEWLAPLACSTWLSTGFWVIYITMGDFFWLYKLVLSGVKVLSQELCRLSIKRA